MPSRNRGERRRRVVGRDSEAATRGKWERLAVAAFEGVIRVDEIGRIRTVNEAACVLFDTPYPPPPGELLGQTVLEATHLRALAELCAESHREGEVREITVRLVGPQERTLRARAIGLAKDAGAMLLLTDETEMLHLRTVRTEFVANVSHELRTPLASIRAMAETLLDGAWHDEEAAPRFLETIIRESDRLVRLSNDLLDLSRAESGERENNRFDLSVLLFEIVSRLRYKAEKQNVLVSLEPCGTLEMSADSSEMDQVFFNLLDNAIKYTPNGGSVTITCERVDASENQPASVVVCVADTGIGILSQDLPRIFERFWRTDRARRFQNNEKERSSGGTGLGLSIVKHIVDAHGGVVQAESELGRGSRFIVTLPLNLPACADEVEE